MPLDAFISLITLGIAAAWTPGPNNALVASSGARFGFRATLPHVTGIAVGFPVMIFLIAVGLGQVFQQSSVLREIVRIGGILVLLWVAWKISHGQRIGHRQKNRQTVSVYRGSGLSVDQSKSMGDVHRHFCAICKPGDTGAICAHCIRCVFCGWFWFRQQLDPVWHGYATLVEHPQPVANL